ncbi:MAG: HAD family phosphatase [Conexivisphaerales archaeon]
MTKYKLAAFDLDGTLTEGEPSWVILHRRFNTIAIGEEGERLYSQGAITYRDFILRDISAWPKPLRKTELQEALASYRLREDAAKVIAYFKGRGAKIALITAALDIMADEVGRRLDADYVLANSLGFSPDGYFNGKISARVEPLQKHLLLEELCRYLGISREETIAVGDSHYDISFLKAAGKGFLIGNRELAASHRLISIDRLSDILTILSDHDSAD